MKTIMLLVGLVILIVAGTGALVWSGAFNIAADDPHWALTVRVMEVIRDRSIAARASSVVAPALADDSLIRAGAGNYDAMCAGCHLQPGVTRSEMSAGLYPKPPAMTRHRIDDAARAFWVIKHGIKMSGMPAWGQSMEDEHIWGMVAFLQQLPKISAERYRELVAASGGHSHDTRRDEPHDHVPEDAHGKDAKIHVHEDGSQHDHGN